MSTFVSVLNSVGTKMSITPEFDDCWRPEIPSSQKQDNQDKTPPDASKMLSLLKRGEKSRKTANFTDSGFYSLQVSWRFCCLLVRFAICVRVNKVSLAGK